MSRLVRITAEAEEAVASATVETLLQVRGVTTAKFELAYVTVTADQEATTEIEIGFVEVLYQTSDGTATGATEVPGDPDDPTPQITGFHSFTGTEPTSGSFIDGGHIPLSGGEWSRYWAEGDGPSIDNATSSRIGVRIITSAAINCYAAIGLRVMAA